LRSEIKKISGYSFEIATKILRIDFMENQTQHPLGFLSLLSGPSLKTPDNQFPNHAQIPIDID